MLGEVMPTYEKFMNERWHLPIDTKGFHAREEDHHIAHKINCMFPYDTCIISIVWQIRVFRFSW
jgi:hypothetical protein